MRTRIFFVTSFILIIAGTLAYSQRSFWQPLSSIYGGDIRFLANTRSDALLASEGSEVYRSTNQGNDWAPAFGVEYGFYALRVVDNGTVFTTGFGSAPSGIQRSTDEGQTWTSVAPWCGSYFCITEDDSGNIYAGGHSACGLDQGLGFVIKSTDNGSSWQWLPYGNIFYDQVEQLVVTPAGFIFALARAGYEGWGSLAFSTDYGTSWNYGESFRGINLSTMTKDHTGHILVGTESNGIYRCIDDRGSSWTPLTTSNGFPDNVSVYTIFVRGSVTLFAGTSEGVYRSTDDGGSWAEADSGLSYRSVSALIEGSHGALYAGTFGGGVFASTNNGESWEERTRGICRSEITAVAEDEHGNLFAGTSDNGGIFKSVDKGSTWKTVNSGIPIANHGTGYYPGAHTPSFSVRSIVPYDGDTLFVVSTGGIFRSTDEGESWSTSLLADITGGGISIDEENGELFTWQTYDGYFHSTDRGHTWHDVGLRWDTLTKWPYGGSPFIVEGDTFLFTGYDSLSYSNRTMRSTDRGKSWKPVIVTGFHGGFGILPSNPYMHPLYGMAFAESTLVFLRSTDHGASWFLVHSFPDHPYSRNLLVNEKGHIYLDNYEEGIYRSTDQGETWTLLTNEKFPLLAMDKDGYLYGGGTCGVLHSAESMLDVPVNQKQPIPVSYKLNQNYPNPFNPSTSISYQISKAGFVSLKIYNLLGQEVATLVNEEKQVGEYKVRWDAGGVPTGVYFYRMTTGIYRETRKLVIVR